MVCGGFKGGKALYLKVRYFFEQMNIKNDTRFDHPLCVYMTC